MPASHAVSTTAWHASSVIAPCRFPNGADPSPTSESGCPDIFILRPTLQGWIVRSSGLSRQRPSITAGDRGRAPCLPGERAGPVGPVRVAELLDRRRQHLG